jgi:UTP-glucose-1-phosphate uridylyltransferase
MVGMQPVPAEELPRVGVGRGEPLDAARDRPLDAARDRPLEGQVYRCTAIVEKPTEAQARAELVTPGLPDGAFLAHAGIYAFSPRILECLSELRVRGGDGELQLTDAQRMLLAGRPDDCYLLRIAGRAHDTGTPDGYAATFAAVRGS